jgi:hypothetical protein
VLSVVWSDTRPGLFFALDASRLHVFDLAESADGPVLSVAVNGAETLDVAAAQLVLGYPDGSICVHALAKRFTEAIPGEAQVVGEVLATRQTPIAIPK